MPSRAKTEILFELVTRGTSIQKPVFPGFQIDNRRHRAAAARLEAKGLIQIIQHKDNHCRYAVLPRDFQHWIDAGHTARAFNRQKDQK